MFKFIEKPNIQKGDKVVIGLGDSYTQGVGAYSIDTWAKYKGRIDVFTNDPKLISEQYENSWVNVLAKKLGYKALNLGHSGTGNRAAVKELYLHPDIMENVTDAVVIYFMSGIERFDFINKELRSEHHHFITMWPNFWDTGATHPELWKAYAESIHSERFIAAEAILNMLEVQEYCRSKGFKLIVSPAFDTRINRDWFIKTFDKRVGVFFADKCSVDEKFVDQFDWSQFYVPEGYRTFMDLLCEYEGRRDLGNGGYYQHFSNQEYPGKYITNCAHPNLEGHKVIADEFYKVITNAN